MDEDNSAKAQAQEMIRGLSYKALRCELTQYDKGEKWLSDGVSFAIAPPRPTRRDRLQPSRFRRKASRYYVRRRRYRRHSLRY